MEMTVNFNNRGRGRNVSLQNAFQRSAYIGFDWDQEVAKDTERGLAYDSVGPRKWDRRMLNGEDDKERRGYLTKLISYNAC
jgi:hypothetical protein